MAEIQPGKKICLITTGHLSSDPRMVKEAIALTTSGYKVHLIFTQYVHYLIGYDSDILKAHPEWSYQTLNWSGNSLQSKKNRLVSKLAQLTLKKKEITINRCFFWQLKKAVSCKADLYIGHNLGALPVAVQAAKKNNVKCGFDAEDLHRHEISNDLDNPDVKLKCDIENKYLPHLDFITASSPQIADQYSVILNKNVTTILNVFPRITQINLVNNLDRPLQLFWFSQTIGPERGLEIIIRAVNHSKINMDLHLLGKCASDYKQYLIGLAQNNQDEYCHFNFYEPIYPDEIFKMAERFDIGLASEKSIPLNRDICLTNKLFTYIQCGLALAGSNTTAQSVLLNLYPNSGATYGDIAELASILTIYHFDRKKLFQTKKACFDLGQTIFNWENESKKFLDVVKQVLN